MRFWKPFAAIPCLLLFCAAAAVAAEPVFVRVNQVGYEPSGTKAAFALSRGDLPEAFEVVDARTNEVVFTESVAKIADRWGEFDQLGTLEFSGFRRSGRFFVRLGSAKSSTFDVADAVYTSLPDQLLEFMRQQRCGCNPWVDADCHAHDGKTVDGPRPAGTDLDARGGWHDAGDQLKYLLTSGNATAQMLLAYQLGEPMQFADRVDDLGKPTPNGIPDLLDEARWGLDWMLKLHPAPDQLYHQVADDRDHSTGFRLPQNETIDYGWGPGGARPVYSADGKPQGIGKYKSESTGVANLAGRYAAAMALGYQIWKDDVRLKPYAERLLAAGREVYSLGLAHPGVQQGNSYKSPYRYAETTWADDMAWGAAELFRATKETKFRDDALRFAKQSAAEGWFDQETIGHYQYYPFMNVGHFRLHQLVSDDEQRELAAYYRVQLEHCLERSKRNPFRVGAPFVWCSNNFAVAVATECECYRRMTGDTRFSNLAAAERDWLLGRNPWGISMFTQIPAGGKFPGDVHLFGTAMLKRQVRGGLVDGPVARSIFGSLKGVSIREPDSLAAFQDDRAVYHDDIHDYSTNEPTMDGTASAILMWVMLGK